MRYVIENKLNGLVWCSREDRFTSESRGTHNTYTTERSARRSAKFLIKRGYSVRIRPETVRNVARIDLLAMVSL